MSGGTQIRSLDSASEGGLPVSAKSWTKGKSIGCPLVMWHGHCHSFCFSSIWTPLFLRNFLLLRQTVSLTNTMKNARYSLSGFPCNQVQEGTIWTLVWSVAAVTAASGPNHGVFYQVLVAAPAEASAPGTGASVVASLDQLWSRCGDRSVFPPTWLVLSGRITNFLLFFESKWIPPFFFFNSY